MALNSVVYTEKVVRSFLRYQLTVYPFADERLHEQMGELLSLGETRESQSDQRRRALPKLSPDRQKSRWIS